MKKWIAVLLVVGLMAFGIIGCGSKEQPANAPGTTEKQTETQSQGGSDLSSIMQKASQVKGMSFDMVSTITGPEGTMNTTGKYYMSGEKVRMEAETMGVKVITIGNAQDEFYLYNPDMKTAVKMTTPETDADLPNAWAKAGEDVSGYTVVGNENKDGYDCMVVTTEEEGCKIKMWLRKDIGMPVRVESTLGDGNILTEFKNYNIGAQPDNLFEIPAGTEITTMPGSPDMSKIPGASE